MTSQMDSKHTEKVKKFNQISYSIQKTVSKWQREYKKALLPAVVEQHSFSTPKLIITSQNIFGAKSCEKLPIIIRVSKSCAAVRMRGFEKKGKERKKFF